LRGDAAHKAKGRWREKFGGSRKPHHRLGPPIRGERMGKRFREDGANEVGKSSGTKHAGDVYTPPKKPASTKSLRKVMRTENV